MLATKLPYAKTLISTKIECSLSRNHALKISVFKVLFSGLFDNNYGHVERLKEKARYIS